MIMNTSPVHRMWHVKARYARDIHSSQLYHRHEESIFRRPGILVSHWPAGLGPHSLAGWGGVGVASGRQHTFPNRPEVCPISFGMAIPRFSKCIPPSIARIHLLSKFHSNIQLLNIADKNRNSVFLVKLILIIHLFKRAFQSQWEVNFTSKLLLCIMFLKEMIL